MRRENKGTNHDIDKKEEITYLFFSVTEYSCDEGGGKF